MTLEEAREFKWGDKVYCEGQPKTVACYIGPDPESPTLAVVAVVKGGLKAWPFSSLVKVIEPAIFYRVRLKNNHWSDAFEDINMLRKWIRSANLEPGEYKISKFVEVIEE